MLSFLFVFIIKYIINIIIKKKNIKQKKINREKEKDRNEKMKQKER